MSNLSLQARQKIGILGGTFDPPHIGHLQLASHFAKTLHLDTLLLVPSGQPWQKSANISSANIRYQLTEAAAIDLARAFLYLKIPTQIGIDRIEIDRAGPSYAIDTAIALRERFGPQASLIWLMGADSFKTLSSWHDWQQLIQYVHFAIASRPHYDLESGMSQDLQQMLLKHQAQEPSELGNHAYGSVYIDEHLSIDLSSTAIRSLLKTQRHTIDSNQIPSHALEIIAKLGLYA